MTESIETKCKDLVLPLSFSASKVHYLAGESLLYMKSLYMCAGCATILLVQFHPSSLINLHIHDLTDKGGVAVCVCVCVASCAKILLVQFYLFTGLVCITHDPPKVPLC